MFYTYLVGRMDSASSRFAIQFDSVDICILRSPLKVEAQIIINVLICVSGEVRGCAWHKFSAHKTVSILLRHKISHCEAVYGRT